ncbi:hypothetical protein K488DRAFT_50111, partial [Vararia minispora EC-137]
SAVITNDPDGNYIVSANIGSDGNTFAGVTSADGLGEHGDDGGMFASDATYSNGIIVVHPETNRLATTNTKSNTVVLFAIDPQNPSRLTMVGSPVSSEGQFPTSVAFNKAGDFLCAMNSGTNAGIFCYDVTSEGLIPKEGSFRSFGPEYNQTTPPAGPINTASQVIFTEDDKNVVAAVKGFVLPQPTRGALFVWNLGDNNTLAQEAVVASTPAPGGFTFSLTPIPGKNAFLSADFSSGLDVWSFENGIENINRSNPRTLAADVPGEITTCWSTWSPTIDSYYLSDPSTCLITEVVLDGNLKPQIVANHTLPIGGENIDVAVGTIGGKDYLYALLTNELSVGVLRLDGTGDATLTGVANFTESIPKAGAPVRASLPCIASTDKGINCAHRSELHARYGTLCQVDEELRIRGDDRSCLFVFNLLPQTESNSRGIRRSA